MLLMRGNREVSKKHLLLVDKYVKKKKNKNQSSGDGQVPLAPKQEVEDQKGL